jgi:hypothetical protein
MKQEDEYLRRANEAQKWADQAKSDKAKAGWLRIAQNWLGLVRRLPVDEKASEESAEQPGVPQEASSASH